MMLNDFSSEFKDWLEQQMEAQQGKKPYTEAELNVSARYGFTTKETDTLCFLRHCYQKEKEKGQEIRREHRWITIRERAFEDGA